MTQPAAIKPYDFGMLEVEDGHAIYWEACGNPEGVPAVYLHGGPGGGASIGIRAWFDPAIYNAILFDQRGCGRSRPLAEAPGTDLSVHTTSHLIADLERLRTGLGVDRWLVLGLSWGTTLGLAYAQAHPGSVIGLVLGLVTTTSVREVEWITEGVGMLFPREWERFAAHVPARLEHLRLVDAYAELLTDSDPDVVAAAALEWCRWEDAHVSLAPGHQPNPRFEDPDFRVRFARLVTHYWRHAAFYEGDELLDGAASLSGIPGLLLHGRYDVSSPLVTAWRLSKLWTTSRLQVMDDAGHGGQDLPALVADGLRSMV